MGRMRSIEPYCALACPHPARSNGANDSFFYEDQILDRIVLRFARENPIDTLLPAHNILTTSNLCMLES